MKQKIRKGDTVEIIAGRAEDKKKRGEVIRVIPTESRVVVQGVNIRSKHQGQTQAGRRNINPGIIKFEAPIHVSNVMLIDSKTKAPTRVGYKMEGGKKVRVAKKSGNEID